MIGEALKENFTLEILDLCCKEQFTEKKNSNANYSDNNIGDFGTKSFGEALKVNKTLKRLNLSRTD